MRVAGVLFAMTLGLFSQAGAGEAFDPSGTWRCTVNADAPRALKSNYSYDLRVSAAANGRFQAKGIVVRPGTAVPVRQVQGFGNWNLTSDASGAQVVRFRMKPKSGDELTWVAQPSGRNAMYHVQKTKQGRTTVEVETACGKTATR